MNAEEYRIYQDKEIARLRRQVARYEYRTHLHMIPQEVLENEYGVDPRFDEYEVGEWRDRESVINGDYPIEDDFVGADLWRVEELDDLFWVVTTPSGQYRKPTDGEDRACREWTAPLGNISEKLGHR